MESQILSFRVRYARMISSGLLPRTPPLSSGRPPFSSLGISFDPYDSTVLPKRIIAVGSAANFPSVVSLVGDVFNAPVFVPYSDSAVANAGPKAKPATSPSGSNTPGGALSPALPSAPVTATAMTAAMTAAATAAHLPAGAVPAPSRASAAIGSAYVARWAWRRHVRPDERPESFEEEVREVLRKHGNSVNGGPYGSNSHSFSHSGLSTPMPRSSSTLSSIQAFHEEDEEDERVLVPKRSEPDFAGYRQSPPSNSNTSSSAYVSSSTSTLITPSSSMNFSNLTLNTSPGSLGLGGYSNSAAVGGGPLSASLTSAGPVSINVSPLPTDDTDLEVGLVKVAEADFDSFMTYAALVPEYCRLEGMLVRALV